jgi:hypothetical protein
MTSPKAFAAYPVYVALYPDEAEKLAGGRFMGYRLGPAPPGKWAQVEANRLAVWDQFEKIIKE